MTFEELVIGDKFSTREGSSQVFEKRSETLALNIATKKSTYVEDYKEVFPVSEQRVKQIANQRRNTSNRNDCMRSLGLKKGRYGGWE